MLVRLDAVFEVALGLALVLAAATGALDGSDFPRPVGSVLLSAIGVLLVLLGAAIWHGRVGQGALALGNAVSAVAGIVWLAATSGFSEAGTAVVVLAVAGLAVLAAGQAATLRT
jgi:hypothetical protein